MVISVDNKERRRHPRTNVHMSVQCVRLDPDGGDMVDRLDVYDLSAGGMGAFSDRAFRPGQRVVLNLPQTNTGRSRNLHATIVRCRQRSQGYRIGMQFDATVTSNWANGPALSMAA